MGAEYLSYVKSIATFAPTFYGYIISVLASVTDYNIICRAQLLCKVYQVVRTNVNVFQKGPKEVGSVASNLLVQDLLRRQLMVKIYRCALMDAVTKGNAGQQRREAEGQMGAGKGTETKIVDPIGAGEVFLDITRVIITMNKIWHKINGLTFLLKFG